MLAVRQLLFIIRLKDVFLTFYILQAGLSKHRRARGNLLAYSLFLRAWVH